MSSPRHVVDLAGFNTRDDSSEDRAFSKDEWVDSQHDTEDCGKRKQDGPSDPPRAITFCNDMTTLPTLDSSIR